MKNVILTAVVLFVFAVSGTAAGPVACAAGTTDENIEKIDLSGVPDGVYIAEERYYGFFTCRVEVTVKNHRITDIKVHEGRKSEYVDQAKTVVEDVIAKQSLQVDAVTGATVTSEAILRAIGKALKEKKLKE